ncbi:hypothetical protein ACHAPT_008539 [Fusarium lateritium]
MTHHSDPHRESSRSQRRNPDREHGRRSSRRQHRSSESQALQQQQQQQQAQTQQQQQQYQQQQYQQQQYAPSYASSSGSTAAGSYAGYAGYVTPPRQNATPDYDAQGHPQTPSTTGAYQGSAQGGQYSSDSDNDPRVRIYDHQVDEPEDPARRTRLFVQGGREDRVTSSRRPLSGRDIESRRRLGATDAINSFDTVYGTASPRAGQYNSGSSPYYPDPEYPDCGDGPNHGGSSYGGH